jgi:hypothetical protein
LCVRRFVERELVALLARSRRWRHGPLVVRRVDLSSNRVRVQVACKALGAKPCELTFEEQSGYIVAGIGQEGFLTSLVRSDAEGALLFENALAGLYQRSEVDLVREQIEGVLGDGVHYDIADDGLLVWPGRDYQTELAYRLDERGGRALPPTIRGAPPDRPPQVLDTRHILFPTQGITWLSWVAAWTAADHDDVDLPRLMQGTSVLPGAGEGGMPSKVPPSMTPRTLGSDGLSSDDSLSALSSDPGATALTPDPERATPTIELREVSGDTVRLDDPDLG